MAEDSSPTPDSLALERLELALASSDLTLWDWDLVTGQVYLNAQWANLSGQPRGESEVPIEELQALMHPEDAPRVQATLAAARAGGASHYAVDYRIRRTDGTWRWIASRGRVTRRDASGRALRMTGTNADIDERKRDEERLAAALLEQQAILAASPAGVFLVGPDRRLMLVNHTMETMFGYEPGEMIGLSTLELTADLDEWQWIGTEGYARIARGELLRAEVRYRRKEGGQFWGLLQGVAIDLADPSKGRLFSAVDITDRKRLEEDLRRADRKKDDFIATLAHELRNPLAPIRNATAVLRQPGTQEAQRAACLEVIERQVGQMALLLEDLLDVSRFTRGKLTLRSEPIELSTVITHAIEIARPQIDDGGHALEVVLPPVPIWLEGDPTRLAQIFSNLLTNAAKYSDRGGKIRLVASATPTAELGPVVVAVEDQGIGIAREHLGRIFEMFSQVELALDRSQGGLGLGLSLVKGLVEKHGGRITAESEGPGRGSRFVVELPQRGAPPLSARADTPVLAAAPDTARRVLVVDDNRDVVTTLAMVFEIEGHEVRRAYDGEEALEVAEAFRPELILLDLGLPKHNGYEVCRQLRARPWGAVPRIVALTGWGQEEDKRRTQEAGFDLHLVKPVAPEQLLELLGDLPG
ncbi:MAG: PAS domain-containing protein [Thermoanaerobaculia bacterium]|nr:PAS domain-containing protein [Thermoanaerobaculia bacterium]